MNYRACFLISFCVVTSSCSSVEKDLQTLAESPSSAVAIKDAKGAYWGFPGSGIETVSGRKLTLKGGVSVFYCSSAEGSPKDIGRALVGDTTGTPAVQGSQTTWKTETEWGRLSLEAGPDNGIRTSGWGVKGVSGEGETKFKLSECLPGQTTKRIDIEVQEILLPVGDSQ